MRDPYTCGHYEKKYLFPRYVVQSDGQFRYVNQCLQCGAEVSKKVGKKRAAEFGIDAAKATPFDFEMRDKHWNDKQRERTNTKAADTEQRRITYKNYINSHEWEARRVKVLERAGHRCEGCLTQPAVHVHHLTYDNIFDELAFQLVALCKRCHEKAHHRESAPNKLGL